MTCTWQRHHSSWAHLWSISFSSSLRGRLRESSNSIRLSREAGWANRNSTDLRYGYVQLRFLCKFGKNMLQVTSRSGQKEALHLEVSRRTGIGHIQKLSEMVWAFFSGAEWIYFAARWDYDLEPRVSHWSSVDEYRQARWERVVSVALRQHLRTCFGELPACPWTDLHDQWGADQCLVWRACSSFDVPSVSVSSLTVEVVDWSRLQIESHRLVGQSTRQFLSCVLLFNK